ncbi:lamin tail domain-containing protein [Parabacteroides sp. PF5-9]|uniref:lamin tail domain-containing protein n=1 Tax=Parabacteroides sp. PF5-9 TaxID=1742404 RepID=UPI0024740762|nr:lamin tail domain-containing protein [Parabacteroides sp. PF5-9]MDH6356299.1 hypothetical protein [Parabacteroides sp. PF5-9]
MKQIILFFAILLPFYSFAQLTESFDGPQITTSYPWEGNTEKFRINANGELQLYTSYYKGEAFVYLPTSVLIDNEWQFTIRTEAACSSQNYFKIFLWSKHPDMKDPGEALFIRLGYTDKNIALCKQTNNLKPELLLEGRRLFDQPTEVTIKIISDVEGRCSVYSKTVKEETFVFEGTAGRFDRNANGYFMLGVYYTAQQSTNKYVDDIIIRHYSPNSDEPNPPDDDPLELLSVDQESPTELLLFFNKPVIAEEASFSLSEIGEITEVYISEDDRVIMLVSEIPLEKGKEYQVSYSNLYDYQGEAYTYSETFTAFYDHETPEPPLPVDPVSPGIVRINEIMANPKGLTALPETEYIELYNTSSTIQSLTGWSLMYGDKATLLDPYQLSPGAYLVLYRTGREIHIDPGGAGMALSKFPAQLSNTGKKLQLTNAAGQLIDAYTYDKTTPALSWEYADEGWYLSTDRRGGTPGSINSPIKEQPEEPEEPEEPEIPEEPKEPTPPEGPVVLPGEIVLNELLPNPYPDGSEYIELYNRSDRALSLSGLAVATRKSNGEIGTVYPLNSVMEWIKPAGYVLLTKDKNGVASNYLISAPENLYQLKLPVLANTSSTLVLFRTADKEVIDELMYSSKWHASTVKEQKGVALERIDPEKPTQLPENWTSASSTAGYGTPGYQNSQFRQNSGNIDGIEAPEYSESTGSYHILYSLNEPGYSCRIRIYNLSGQLIVVIANHELLGTQGSLTWDGSASNGSRLKTGVYIFHAELYHMNGETQTYKKVFLVR